MCHQRSGSLTGGQIALAASAVSAVQVSQFFTAGNRWDNRHKISLNPTRQSYAFPAQSCFLRGAGAVRALRFLTRYRGQNKLPGHHTIEGDLKRNSVETILHLTCGVFVTAVSLLLSCLALVAVAFAQYEPEALDTPPEEPAVEMPGENAQVELHDGEPPGEPVAEAPGPDPIQTSILNAFRLAQGRAGDGVVLGSFALMLLCLWKKLYRMSVGFLVIFLGTVFIRVLISLFYGRL